MSILTITSTNPNLSHVISKNPETISSTKKPFERDLRKGRLYGWFTNKSATQFRLHFVDSSVENSFGSQEFEFLDIYRYASPYAPIAMIAEGLRSALTKPNEYDVPEFKTSVTTNIRIPERVLNRLSKLKDLSYFLIVDDHYKIQVESNSVHAALNQLQIVCFLACLADYETYIPLKEEVLEKYIRSLNTFDAPYAIRYMVASRAISSRQSFDKLAPLLNTETINLNYGDTRIQRQDELVKYLTGGETLFDIGCGEMFHSFKFMKTYNSVFAVEANEELYKFACAKVARKKLDDKVFPLHATVNAEWVRDNETILKTSDVLIGECLEHMEKKEAIELLHALIDVGPQKIVITVPNKDFNHNYGIADDEFRHPDHEWEPTYVEFQDLVFKAAESSTEQAWTFTLGGIGDSVNGVHLSLIAVFTRKD